MNKAYELAREDIGTWEWKGAEHNPKVLKYYDDVGEGWVSDDETPWCGAFVGAMLTRVGMPIPKKPLLARAYLEIGEPVDLQDAQPGDLVIFERGNSSWQGHVGFLVGKAGTHLRVLGGNQNNQVNVAKYQKRKLLGVRRIRDGRQKISQSTTMQATGVGGVGTATAGITAIGNLDGTAQIVAIVATLAVLGALAWIARERIDKWRRGIR